ncbi:uncharacterized protein LOC110029099 [Phalaenopsis equestris]|uniref:uncharacterized protein LOC110029099 n=1 Tax=Phalaenopsis equestris TaxID=78828 RepID=UPI0009E4DB01|nr:uncharacterized protein LOC110029099 [Phalaenopsis equestris]
MLNVALIQFGNGCSICEFLEVSNVALQSSNQWCWSSSAAVSSDSFSPQHNRKKKTKLERSAMVLAFVEKYRTLNGGKFPTVSCTQKQVGGSYYVVREIIQALEHNHKSASLETQKGIKVWVEMAKCDDVSSTREPFFLSDAKQTSFKEFEGDTTKFRMENSSNKTKEGAETSSLSIEAHLDSQIKIDAIKMSTPSRVTKEDKGLDFDKLSAFTSPATVKPQTHASGMSDAEALNVRLHTSLTSEEVGHQVSAKLESKTSVLHTSTEEIEACGKDAASASNLHEEAFRSEELYHGQRQMIVEGAASTKRSSFWGNLKSMAFGIINLWK